MAAAAMQRRDEPRPMADAAAPPATATGLAALEAGLRDELLRPIRVIEANGGSGPTRPSRRNNTVDGRLVAMP
jgi:hypothetical protein